MIIVDGHGQIGIALTGEGGGMGGYGASVGTQYSVTTADTIQQTGGQSGLVGGSANVGPTIGAAGVGLNIGGEVIVGKNYGGGSLLTGIGVGSVVEEHGAITNTKIYCIFNCKPKPPCK
jgi:hypothetical protein